MAYTVGLKRRFLPGYKKYLVNDHSWENFRYVLNLTDGSQIHFPGFQVHSLKVYDDFWTHLAQVRQDGAALQKELLVLKATRPQPPVFVPPAESTRAPEPDPVAEEPQLTEAQRRAYERVRQLSQSTPDAGSLGFGSYSQQ